MSPVYQHGKGNLQQRGGLRDAVDQPEGQISGLQLIGQADHGGGTSAADDSVQVAEDIREQDQIQTAADRLGQAGLGIEQGQGGMAGLPDQFSHEWMSFPPAAHEIAGIIASGGRDVKGENLLRTASDFRPGQQNE